MYEGLWHLLEHVNILATNGIRPKPHRRQAGRTGGSDWARGRAYNQTAAMIRAGHLTWPGSLGFKSSRGRSLELQLRGADGPPCASTSTSKVAAPWTSCLVALALLYARRCRVVGRLVACGSGWRRGSRPYGLTIARSPSLPASCLGRP